MTNVAVNGAAGRMGRTVIDAAAQREDVEITEGYDVTGEGSVRGITVHEPDRMTAALADHGADVLVDFTVPEASLAAADACRSAGVAMVVGTTGFDEAEREELIAASADVPVLKAANFSRGVTVLQRTVREAVATLDDYDLELLETHHDGKVDAPSGTAKSILDTVRAERDVEPVYGREGHAPRDEDEIGVFARRAGDIRGEHELILAGNDEVLSLSHRAEDRAVFAAGALDAATWLAGRDPGDYSFDQVIDDA